MPIKQITSSRVHPGSQMKEGEWRFALTGGKLGTLYHKFSSILWEWPAFRREKPTKWWIEYHLPAHSVSPGASGATLTVLNTSSLVYLLNATNEYIYFDADVHHDWNEVTDLVVNVLVALENAETANDIIEAELIVEYFTDHDDMTTGFKTQTRTVNHSIGTDTAAGTLHDLTFILDHDLASNVIEQSDVLKFRFRLDSVASVPGVHFLAAYVKYVARDDWQADKVTGAFPTEG